MAPQNLTLALDASDEIVATLRSLAPNLAIVAVAITLARLCERNRIDPARAVAVARIAARGAR